MGNNSRKKYSADFKAKVALEALKEQMALPELEKKFGVSQYMISRWKSELSKNASQTFYASGSKESHQREVDNLQRKIGEVDRMQDFAKGHRESWECGCSKIFSPPRARVVAEQAA